MDHSGLAFEEMARLAWERGGRPSYVNINPATMLFALVDTHRQRPPWWRVLARRRWRARMDYLLSLVEYRRLA